MSPARTRRVTAQIAFFIGHPSSACCVLHYSRTFLRSRTFPSPPTDGRRVPGRQRWSRHGRWPAESRAVHAPFHAAHRTRLFRHLSGTRRVTHPRLLAPVGGGKCLTWLSRARLCPCALI